MIQTEVKALGSNEHQVHVRIPRGEYDRIYAEQIQKLSRQARLPGFRPGKTPNQVIEKQFGAKLHDDTVSELIQSNYVEAIESSGLVPAVQPELDILAVQGADSFEFTMKVTTWPKVKVKSLSKLKFDTTTVDVEASDIESVIERLQKSQVKFNIERGSKAEDGDQLHIDFVGSIDGEPFDGGKGEDVALVLGEGRFIPGFEEQLLGHVAGDDVTVEVTFPEQYQAAHLAGKHASFAVTVKSVGKPVQADNEDDLARMLGFDDAKALHADVEARLNEEAEQASFSSTREAALDALLAANDVDLPEALIAEDMRTTTQRVLENMKQQGVPADRAMFEDDAFKKEVRERSEKGLKLSILLQTVRELGDVSADDAEVDAEIDRQAQQYPEDQHEQFKAWIKGQQDQMASLRERLLERKCVEYIVSKAKTKSVSKPLSVWQAEQDKGE